MFKKFFTMTALFVSMALLAGCGGGNGKNEKAENTGGGGTAYDASTATATIKGKVTLSGKPSAAAPIDMGADPVCQSQHSEKVPAQEVIVNTDGTLQNVFVYVQSGAEKWSFSAPTTPVELDQKGCLYSPRVTGAMVGQDIELVNSDATFHNVHSMGKNGEANIAMSTKGMKQTRKTEQEEIMYNFKCDVHPWMHGYLGVVKNPFFATTGPNGTFEIKLPPGDYTLGVWHEKYGTQTVKVSVKDKEAKNVSISFKAS